MEKKDQLRDLLRRNRSSSHSESSSDGLEDILNAFAALSAPEQEEVGRTRSKTLVSRVSGPVIPTPPPGAVFLDKLSAFVKRRKIDSPGLLWRMAVEAVPGRTDAHFQLLYTLVQSQYSSLGPLFRRETFRWCMLDGNDDIEHFSEKMRVLVALTQNGRDVSPFEIELGDVLALWLTNHFDGLRVADSRELLSLLTRAIVSTPSFLSAENKTLIIQRCCVVASNLRLQSQVPVVDACLQLLEVIVQRSVKLPPNCLVSMIASLCCTVNIDKLCDQSWRIARGLLSSAEYGVEALQVLCQILQSQYGRSAQNIGSVLRGAVFFVGMSCWGKDRVESLYFAPSTVLPSLVKATRSGHSVAAYEVLLSVRRLIRKQGSDLTIEWDNILSILSEMSAYTSSGASSSAFVRVLVDTLNTLRVLSDSNRFLADPHKILWLLEEHASLLPSGDALRLLRKRLAQVPPLSSDEIIERCLRNHLLRDQRAEARMAALAEIMDWLSHGSTSGAVLDEARVTLVVPVWRDLLDSLLATPNGHERGPMLSLIQQAAKHVAAAAAGVRKETFYECMDVLVAHISSDPGPTKRNTALSQAFDEAAAEGIVSIFASELAGCRGRRARFVMLKMVTLLHHPSSIVRHRVLHCFSGVRANAYHHASLHGEQSCIMVGPRGAEEGSGELFMAKPVDALVQLWQVEESRPLHGAISATLYEWLWNKFVVAGIVLDGLVAVLCSRLRPGKLAPVFRSVSKPHTIEDTEAVEQLKMLYQIAVLLIPYDDQFKQPLVAASELLITFCNALLYPSTFLEEHARAAIQRVCLNGLCFVLAHYPQLVNSSSKVAEAIVAAARVPYLALYIPRVLLFISKVPGFGAGLSTSHHLNLMDSILVDVAEAKYSDYQLQQRLLCACQWLLLIGPEERIGCYNRILPQLVKGLKETQFLLFEAFVDVMATFVFLQCFPSRVVASTPDERFGFRGRPSLSVVQGNCVMDIVSGMHDWLLVTLRRPSGRVTWMMRLQSELLSTHFSQSHYGRDVPPLHSSYKSLSRVPSALEMAMQWSKGGSEDFPRGLPASPVPLMVAGPTLSIAVASQANVASPQQRPVTTVSPAQAVLRSSGDSPPLHPKLAFKVEIPIRKVDRPDVLLAAATGPGRVVLDEEDGKRLKSVMVHHDSDTGEESEESLRMAPLFFEGDEAEEERDFFVAHSLDGSRAQSYEGKSPTAMSSSSASPIRSRNVAAPFASAVTAVSSSHAAMTEPIASPVASPAFSAAAAAVANNSTRRKESADVLQSSLNDSLLNSSGSTYSPNLGVMGSPSPTPRTTPTSSSSTLSVNTVAESQYMPHSSLLFHQMRYVPFADDVPVRLAATPALSRAVSVLDYIPSCNVHKLAVLFVAKGQRTEAEIFSNKHGSVAYSQFIRGLGETICLKGFQGYAGGLDTQSNVDGVLSVRFQDELTEVMFHCATMMPSGDILAKKRHIGNDNVHIVWDESGEYDAKIMQGDFHFVSIVIVPVGTDHLRVSVHRKRELGHFVPFSITKLIRADVGPVIVRQTAIDADREVIAVLASERGEDGLGGIVQRLRQLKKIKQMTTTTSTSTK